MADGGHFQNRHVSSTVQPIAKKFGILMLTAPVNFIMPARTIHLLFYLIKPQ